MAFDISIEQLAERQQLIETIRAAQAAAMAVLSQGAEKARLCEEIFRDTAEDEFGTRENRVHDLILNGQQEISGAFDRLVGQIVDWLPDHGRELVECRNHALPQ